MGMAPPPPPPEDGFDEVLLVRFNGIGEFSCDKKNTTLCYLFLLLYFIATDQAEAQELQELQECT